ncbi:MAG: phage holin family protein [Acidimicrobiia bacterium]|nr:phage holin family protein [Acidimicrobiia bacterium]
MKRIVIRIAINALALWVAAGLIGGITLEEGFWKLVLAAAVFGIVNAFLKPLLILLSLPAVILSLGIALIVINAVLLVITDALTDALEIENFGSALLGALVISAVSWAAGRLLPDKNRHDIKFGGPRNQSYR